VAWGRITLQGAYATKYSKSFARNRRADALGEFQMIGEIGVRREVVEEVNLIPSVESLKTLRGVSAVIFGRKGTLKMSEGKGREFQLKP